MTSKVEDLQLEIEMLDDALKDLKEQLVEARKSQQNEKLLEAEKAIRNAPYSAFLAENKGGQWDNRPYILPYGRDYSKWSAWEPQNHPFGCENMTALILQRKDQPRTRPTRIVVSSGIGLTDSDHDKIGRVFTARHDQTGARLGVYEIVGLAFYGVGGRIVRMVGEVPKTKLSTATYK